MAMIPDVSARVKRLRVYERQLSSRMAFDDQFGAESKKRRDKIMRNSRCGKSLYLDSYIVNIADNL